MSPKEAFDAIGRTLSEDVRVRVVRTEYDAEFFGNFHIAFWEGDSPHSIICDRGQIWVCDDLEAAHCTMVVEAIYYADPDSLLDAVWPSK